MKRLTDVLASALGLVFLGPLLAAVSLAVALGGGPVLFRQVRVGLGGRHFEILKFRTMVVAAQAHGPLVTARGDRRITRVGRVLRRTKLDELPQLVNVLRGDMSLVGPRPEVPRYVEAYPELYAPLLRHRPGITSACALALLGEERLLGQVADPERFYVQEVLPRKIHAYRRELRERSLARDLRTIVATVLPLRRLRPRVEPAPLPLACPVLLAPVRRAGESPAARPVRPAVAARRAPAERDDLLPVEARA